MAVIYHRATCGLAITLFPIQLKYSEPNIYFVTWHYFHQDVRCLVHNIIVSPYCLRAAADEKVSSSPYLFPPLALSLPRAILSSNAM